MNVSTEKEITVARHKNANKKIKRNLKRNRVMGNREYPNTTAGCRTSPLKNKEEIVL